MAFLKLDWFIKRCVHIWSGFPDKTVTGPEVLHQPNRALHCIKGGDVES